MYFLIVMIVIFFNQFYRVSSIITLTYKWHIFTISFSFYVLTLIFGFQKFANSIYPIHIPHPINISFPIDKHSPSFFFSVPLIQTIVYLSLSSLHSYI